MCSCPSTMFSKYNLSLRPLSAQSPNRVPSIDNKQPRSVKWGGLKLTLRRRQICKNCTSLKIENTKLLHEIQWLKTGVQKMVQDKGIEVFERVSMTLDHLYNENERLKEKLFIEDRIRVWGTSYTPFDKVDFIREKYHRSLDEITDLELKIREKENEAWTLKNTIHKKTLELKWFEEDMQKKENDALKMKQRILEVEFDNCRYRIALNKMTEDYTVINARFQELAAENDHLKRAFEDKSIFSFLDGRSYSSMEKEVIENLKEDVSNKEKEIKSLQDMVSKEERNFAQLQSCHVEDSLLQRKDSEVLELLQKNQHFHDEINILNSEKKQLEENSESNDIRKELNIRREEIDSLQNRIRQLEAKVTILQRQIDCGSKDGHNLQAWNSNAADEMKILQTALEGKQTEIQSLQNNCTLYDKEITELKAKYSEERHDLFQRIKHLQVELNELNEKKRHLEENVMKTTDEWKHFEKVQDTAVQLGDDNERLKLNIATLSKEKESALSRYYDAENEVRRLKLDIKSKHEEIQRLQKQITQKEGHNEELQDILSNVTKENNELVERLEKVNSNHNDQIQLAADESKRFQEKIKELQSENSHLRQEFDSLSKQKEDALKKIRNLENVNLNYNEQLVLSMDESKRLQWRIQELHSENSRLQRDIDDLSKKKEDALTRLSKVAGAKLTHGNAAITDLSDTDRPTKLAEIFSELYDNAWTDAFEELDNTFHNEEETIKVLLRIFQEAYTLCVQIENNYETRIGQAVFTLANETESRKIPNANVEIQKVLADLRISLSTACSSVFEEMLLSKLQSILRSVDVAACPLIKLYARQCANLSWKMRIRNPPLFVRFEFRHGSTFNADVLKTYTKAGEYLDFLVWPALYLHEKGPVLAKGVAQPMIAP